LGFSRAIIMLHFGAQELPFECATEIQCECGLFEASNEMLDGIMETKSYFHASETLRNFKSGSATLGVIWQDLVQMYSSLNLIKSSDKLVACGGLAKISQRPNDRYIAGLWESCLLQHLQWYVSKETRARPAWRAPSWSWVSVGEPVRIAKGDNVAEQDPHHSVEVIACTTASKANDEYGQIASGSIRLRGYCTPVTTLRLLPRRYGFVASGLNNYTEDEWL
jgi:hypothetical protein